jgi:hypothetical protein
MTYGAPKNILSWWTQVAYGAMDQTHKNTELVERKKNTDLTYYLGINCSKIAFFIYLVL